MQRTKVVLLIQIQSVRALKYFLCRRHVLEILLIGLSSCGLICDPQHGAAKRTTLKPDTCFRSVFRVDQ